MLVSQFFCQLLLILMALATVPQAVRIADPLPGFPRVILWAWERAETLDFLDPARTGVAMLAGTVTLGNGKLRCRPRMQPLRMPPTTPLMVTVRVESAGNGLPSAVDAANCALAWTKMPGTKALQIDFDARLSERTWYRELLTELRRRLPSTMPLTMTALASWCEQDGWIRGLPVAETVPMLFRMGQGEIWNGLDFGVPLCRGSVGIATDELPEKLPRGRRVYFFHPGRWTEDAYHAAWKDFRRFQ